MRLLLLTAGSRGDVEPFVALAREAVRQGHDVQLSLPDRGGADVTGLDTRSLNVDFAGIVASQGVTPLAAARSLKTTVRPLMRTLFVNAVTHCFDFEPDIIVHHPKVLSAALAASKLQVPRIVAEITPSLTPTRAFPAPGVLNADLGPLNRATYLAAAASSRMFAAELSAAARTAGVTVTAARSAADATVMPISPYVLNRPSDWPESVHLTGPWREPDRHMLNPQVEEFLQRGPFLYAGFGSMAAGDASARAATIIAAARERSLQVLVVAGWGGLDVPAKVRGDDVLAVPSVPHEQVLPRAFAAVHHGGAGTVHAVGQAGTVSVVVPFFADQPFWGRMLHSRHLAPAPIPQRRLNLYRLRRALQAVEHYRPAAHTVAEQMQSERGTAAACNLIRSCSSHQRPTTLDQTERYR